MSIIKVENLKKYYGKTKAVDDISFEVQKGEILGFLGPNGAGKTTTIRCMMNFLSLDEGKITILNKDSHKCSAELKKDIGYLSGEVELYENWTGKEHIALLKKLRKGKFIDSELIRNLEFDPSKKFKNLSSGNKQKLGLILALMHRPKVLILDEPTSGLDPLLQDVIYDTLKSEVKKGKTIFMSSHNLAEVERICDRVVILREGKIVGREKISDLKKKRMYTVYVYFDEKVARAKIESSEIQVNKTLEKGFLLTVTGDIRPLLRKLDNFKVKDIEITHSSLEDVFLEFYRS